MELIDNEFYWLFIDGEWLPGRYRIARHIDGRTWPVWEVWGRELTISESDPEWPLTIGERIPTPESIPA